jgi:hypothetical protein
VPDVGRPSVDPGVFISLIGQRGSAPDLVLRAFAEDRVGVVVSPLLLAELKRLALPPVWTPRPPLSTFAPEVDHPVAVELGDRSTGVDAFV